MPEEEGIKKRLLEIKQIRDNPEMFRPENTRNFKFSQVSAEVAKPSTAKEEEEKILILVSCNTTQQDSNLTILVFSALAPVVLERWSRQMCR